MDILLCKWDKLQYRLDVCRVTRVMFNKDNLTCAIFQKNLKQKLLYTVHLTVTRMFYAMLVLN
ncbi:hypothetical protein C0J52_21436 [Blattella germanica]|nr:hypothetical protein C0J52_21436 [Blattella germanica]